MTEQVPVTTLTPLQKEDVENLPKAAKRRLKLSQLIWGVCIAAGIGMLGLVGYGYYLSFYPFRAAEAQQQPYTIVDKELTAGDPIVYIVDLCRYTDVQSVVSPQLVGKTTINLPSYFSKVPTGCTKTQVANSFIPSYAPAGEYYLRLNIDYPVNPLRIIHKEFYTETFIVVK